MIPSFRKIATAIRDHSRHRATRELARHMDPRMLRDTGLDRYLERS